MSVSDLRIEIPQNRRIKPKLKIVSDDFTYIYTNRDTLSLILVHRNVYMADASKHPVETANGFVSFFQNQKTGKHLAVKFVEKKKAAAVAKHEFLLNRQINDVSTPCYSKFLHLLNASETPDKLYTVFVFAGMDMDLGQYMHFVKKKKLHLKFHTVRSIIGTLIGALKCLLEARILHGDMRLENVLVNIDAKADVVDTVLFDFDCSVNTNAAGSAFSAGATQGYVVLPRLLESQKGKGTIITIKDDIWALGVVLFCLVTETEHSPWFLPSKFTPATMAAAVRQMTKKAVSKKWTRVQIEHVLKWFHAMIDYDPAERFSLQKLNHLLKQSTRRTKS
jgi:serine/threonine protein kinase